VDLEVAAGELASLIGPNGVGKSTLLRSLTGYLTPLAGKVTLDGVDLSRLRPIDRALKIAYVPQSEPPVFDFSVFDVVLMGRTPHGDEATAEPKIERALATLGLTPLRDRPVTRISGGELQRTLIARALVQEAPFMLLDEPTAHLDLGHQAITMGLLRRLVEGGNGLDRAGVLCVLQDLNLAAEFSDRVVLVHPSGKLLSGTPGDVLTQPILTEIYGDRVQVTQNPETGRPALFVHRPPL